jgi:hypothetical protein
MWVPPLIGSQARIGCGGIPFSETVTFLHEQIIITSTATTISSNKNFHYDNHNNNYIVVLMIIYCYY